MFADIQSLKTSLTNTRDAAGYARAAMKEELAELRSRFMLNSVGKERLAYLQDQLEG